jgi:hypothetical protein
LTLKFRWTQSGRVKQQQDELAAWQSLVASVQGTGSQASVAAATVVGGGGAVVGFNTAHANYALWRDAHRVLTRRARVERQRQQQVAAAGLPAIGAVQPCQVDAALAVRQTLQIALLEEPTSDVAGTRLSGNNGKSVAKLLAHMRAVLDAVDDELNVRARHREAQDLTISGMPPLKLFVAPEWYFRPPGRAYTTAERAAVITGLEAISRSYPDWLLVPGSIYWSPDPPANAIIRVWNQAPVLYAGELLLTRTKRNEHDIPVPMQNRETWGMNNPAALPGAIAAPSLQPAIFNHGAREWCVDICRDHFVGEGACGYAATAPGSAGAHVYVVTSNTTALADCFLAARNNGVVVHCDGGTSTWRVYTMGRAGGGLAAINAQLLAYQIAFAAQRAPSLTFADAQIHVAHDRLDPAYLTFRPRFDHTMALLGDPTTIAVTGALAIAGAPHNHNDSTREAFRIEDVILNNRVVNGAAPTPAEQVAMTAYVNHLRTQGVALHQLTALTVPGNPAEVAKNALIAAAGAINRVQVNALGPAPHPSASLFPLIDI